MDELLIFGRKAVLAAIDRALSAPFGQQPWPLVIDGTAGNGVDTEFLARAVEEQGRVLAFDIQDEAIEITRRRLEGAGVRERVRLIRDSHDRLPVFVEPGQKVAAAMFNLGFLPGSSSSLATLAESTTAALKRLQSLMAPGGVVCVHCYTGHEEGEAELLAVQKWASELSWPEWRVLRYEFCNKPVNKEVLFLAHCV